MKHEICDSEAGARLEIPESEFLAAIVRPLSELLRNAFNLSETSCHFLIWLYPLLKDGMEWTPADLLAEVGKNTQMGETIKNRSGLLYHLDMLMKFGLLKKIEGDRVRYALSDYALQELQSLDRFLYSKGLRKILEDHIIYIYILLCCIARLIHGKYPSEMPRQIFALTSTLFHIATELTITDLKTRGVLEHQCEDCGYPYHRVEWGPLPPPRSIEELIGPDPIVPSPYAKLRPEELDALEKELMAQPDDPPTIKPFATKPLRPELVRDYIGKEKVVTRTQLLAHFEVRGYPRAEIAAIIADLLAQGVARYEHLLYSLVT